MSQSTGSSDQRGLAALVMLLRFQGLSVDPGQIRHQFGTDAIGVPEMLRCAKELGLKARVARPGGTGCRARHCPASPSCATAAFCCSARPATTRSSSRRRIGRARRLMTRAELEAVWDGRLVLMTRRAEPHRSLASLRHHLVSGRRSTSTAGSLSEVLVASFFLQLFALVSPLFFQVVIDKVLVHRSMSTLDVLVIGLVAIALFETILGILRTYLFSHTTNRIDVELGARLFRHLLALPIAYFQARRVGDSVARVRELENIRNFLTSSALTLVIDLFFTFVFLAVMFFYSPLLTWIVLGSFPFYIAISAAATPLFRRRLDEKFRPRRREPGVPGRERDRRRDAQGDGGRAADAAPLGGAACRLCRGQLPRASAWAIPRARPCSSSASWSRRASSISAPSSSSTASSPSASWSPSTCWPAASARRCCAWRRSGRISIRRACRSRGWAISSTRRPSRSTIRAAQRCPAIRGDVTFEHVTFRYRIDGPEVLHDVSLNVPAGQVVGIVGPSGSGKSTLAKLVQRLYVPESGRVLVDGVDLAQVDPAWLRRQIGVVLQENVLFNRSVRDNIALADPAMPIERVIAAAKLAGAHDFILELPEGYDTIVGERGSSLSGRPAAAHRHRPRADYRSAHPDLRRGDKRARLRERAHRSAEHGADRARPHGVRHRASALGAAAWPTASSPSSAAA